MRYLILTIILLISGLSAMKAQKNTGYSYVNRMMFRVPESMTQSTDGLALYINKTFSSERDKARAVFVWIARSIEYNFDSIITNSIYETPSEVSARILKSRTGVCLNIAHLFTEIASKTGIEAYIVQGYTRQNGKIDYLPHVWCAAYIDTAWYLVDPTWGSGYYSRGRYVAQVNGFYFMTKPAHMIRTHMPFDPMWQLLHYPVSHRVFAKRGKNTTMDLPFFNFNDTIEAWKKAPEIEKAALSAERIEKSGVTNNFIAAKVRVLKGEVTYLTNKMAAAAYDTAVVHYNNGIHALNRFITNRNNQFMPEDSIQMKLILDSAGYHFNAALTMLDNIKPPEQHIALSMIQLSNAIQGTIMAMNEQRVFLYRYIRQGKQGQGTNGTRDK